MIQAEIETDILPFCAKHNIGTLVYSPMKSGMLTGAMTRERIAGMPDDDFRKRTPNFQEPLLTRNLNLVEHRRRKVGVAKAQPNVGIELIHVIYVLQLRGELVRLAQINQNPV